MDGHAYDSGGMSGYEESMQTRTQDDLFGDDFTPVAEPTVQSPPAAAPTGPRNNSSRGRGRAGRARGSARGRGDASTSSTTHRPPSEAPLTTPSTAPIPASLAASQHASPSLLESKHAPPQPDPPAAPAQTTTTTTPPPAPARTAPALTAVRGDRTATGGLRKPKLTDAELAEKMRGISVKNETLLAAHARAEADAASFAQREEHAATRRKEERRDRQQMMGEREKNRLRKLKASEGREWDAEKQEEEDVRGAGRSGIARGAHGGVVGGRGAGAAGAPPTAQEYTDGREYMYREDRGRGRGRGGGGGGRGGHDRPQTAPKANDFPDLPQTAPRSADRAGGQAVPALSFPAKGSKKDTEGQADAGAAIAQVKTDAAPAGQTSWADMVE